MHWHLVHTKPRQEKCALQNLEQQGYQCYLPILPSEKLDQGSLTVKNEPLFPRYLFIRLGHGPSMQSWAPIRSTKGVCRLVSFGIEPAKVDDRLIDVLRAQEKAAQAIPECLFKPGERIKLSEGAFFGLEGIYQMADGDHRVTVLIELMNKPVAMSVAPASLQKAS